MLYQIYKPLIYLLIIMNFIDVLNTQRTQCLNPILENDPIIDLSMVTWDQTLVTGQGRISTNQAIYFNGNQFGTVPEKSFGGEVTFSCWVNFDTITGGSMNDRTVALIYAYQSDKDDSEFCVRKEYDYDNQFGLAYDGTITNNDRITGGYFTPGTWQHVAVSYNSQSLTTSIYLDGQVTASKTTGNAFDYSAHSNIYIGKHGPSYVEYEGWMEELQLFDYALSEEQIKCLADICAVENCVVCNNHLDCIQCLDGYYLNQNGDQCLICDIQCSTCTGTSDNCLVCASIENRNTAPACDCQSGFKQFGLKCIENLRQYCINPVLNRPYVTQNHANFINSPSFGNGKVTSDAVILYGSQYGLFDTLYFGGQDFSISYWARYDFTSLSGITAHAFTARKLDGFEARFYVRNSGTTQQIIFDNNTTQNLKTFNASGSVIQLQEWTHYAIVQNYDNNILKIYINGEFIQSISETVEYIDRDDNQLGIKGALENPVDPFIGGIDEFQLFQGQALSEEQIKCLAEVCIIENCQQCENHLICNECNIYHFMNDDQNVCTACESQCLNCENNSQNCTQCINTENRGDIPNCECNEGYYQQYQTCVKKTREVCLNPQDINNSILNLHKVNFQNTPTFIEGKVSDSAVNLQGTNYGTIYPDVSFGGASFTLSTWIYQNEVVSGTDGYINIGEKTTGTPSNHRFYLSTDSNSSTLFFQYLTTSSNRNCPNLEFEQGVWGHFAATYNHPEQYIKVYTNGNLQCTLNNLNIENIDRSGNSLVGWDNSADKPNIKFDDQIKCLAEICSISNCIECNNHQDCINCREGYYLNVDNGVSQCLICDDQCAQCVATSENCTTCSSSVTGISNPPSCRCPSGYYLQGTDCIEIKRNNCLDPSINNVFFGFQSTNNVSWDTTPQQEIGIVTNNAYIFDGSNYGSLSKQFGNTSLTISFWLKVTSTATSGSLYVFIFKESSSSMNNYIYAYVNLSTLKLEFGVKDAAGATFISTSDVDVIINKWQYWAIVYDQDNINLKYYNGGEVFSNFEDLSSIQSIERTSQSIGSQETTGNNEMVGVIDEFLMFQQAMSNDQIKCLAEICPIANCKVCPNINLCTECDLGYSLINSGLFCQECNTPNCSDCSDDPDVCNSCADTISRDISNQCSCNDGYFEVNQTACTQCTSPCLTCNTASNCLSCVSDNRQLPTCACSEQYFEDNNLCIACQNKCLECTTTFDNCTQCFDITRQNPPNCECADGYYEENNGSCATCIYPCINCTSESVCLSCQDNNASLPSCECNAGYYDSGSSCLECQSQCSTCANLSGNCLTCANATRANPPDCNCDSGYYEDANDICQECTYPCINCSQQANSCLSCVDTPNRNAAPECDCISGYYENNQGCVECDSKCLECSTTSSNCDTCFDFTRENPPTCGCKDSYYQNGNQSSCSQCQYPCINCLSDTICVTCITTVDRGSAPDCECNSGLFDNGSFCQSCSQKCALCQNDSNQCTQCSDATRDSVPECNCLEGYFEEGNSACTQCSYPCETCISASTCITCSSAANLQNPPACSCQDNTYQSGQSCIECDFQCNGCTSSSDNCTECYDLTRHIAPSCNCIDGFFQEGNNQSCQQCQYPCENCSSATVCISCKTTLNRGSIPDCECSIGFYDNTVECSQCSHKCQVCSGTSNNCLSCSDITRQNLPECDCLDGYYNDGTNSACLLCQDPCLTCSSLNQCITCINTFNRSAPTCECDENTYLVDQNCTQCSIKCQGCSNNSDNCTNCGSTTRELAPQCSCKSNYYETNETNCGVCQAPCLECSSQTVCISCVSTENRQQAPSCQCLSGYQDISNICVQNYTTNTGGSSSSSNQNLGNVQLNQYQFTWNILEKATIPTVYLNIQEQEKFSFKIKFTEKVLLDQVPKIKIQLNKDQNQFYFENTVTFDQITYQYTVDVLINESIVNSNLIIYIENYDTIQDGENNYLEDKQEEILIERYIYYTQQQRDRLDFQSNFTNIMSNGSFILAIQNLVIDSLSSGLTSFNYLQNVLLFTSIQKSSLINEITLFQDLQVLINFNLNSNDFQQSVQEDSNNQRILVENQNQSSDISLSDISVIKLLLGQLVLFSIILFLHLIFIVVDLIQNLIYKNQKPLNKKQTFIKNILKEMFQYSIYHKYIIMSSQVFVLITFIKVQNTDFLESVQLMVILLGMIVYILYFMRYILSNINSLYYCNIPYYIFDLKTKNQKEDQLQSQTQSLKSIESTDKSEDSQLVLNLNEQKGFQHRVLWENIKQIKIQQKDGIKQQQSFYYKYLVLYTPIYLIKQWFIIMIINIFKNYSISLALVLTIFLEIIQLFVILVLQPFKRYIDNLKLGLIQIIYLIGLCYFTVSVLQVEDQNQDILYKQMQSSIIIFLLAILLNLIFSTFDLLYIPYAVYKQRKSLQIKPKQTDILMNNKQISQSNANSKKQIISDFTDIENSPQASPTQSHRQFINYKSNNEEEKNNNNINIDDAQELNNIDEIQEENIYNEENQESLHKFQEKFVNRRLALDTLNFNNLQLQDFNQNNNYKGDLVKNLVFGHKVNDQYLQKQSQKEGRLYKSYLKQKPEKNQKNFNNIQQQETIVLSQINSFCSDDIELISQFSQNQNAKGGTHSHFRKHKNKKNFQNVEILQESQDHTEQHQQQSIKQMNSTGFQQPGFKQQQDDVIKMNKTFSSNLQSSKNKSVKQNYFNKQESFIKVKNIEQIQEQNQKQVNKVNSIYISSNSKN